MHEPSALALARSGGSPSALHNACSGKHIGFICLAQTLGVDHHGYASVDHSVQKEVRSTIENLAGVSLSTNDCGIDGCSVPTWALPLRDLALAFARFGTGHGLGPERAKAAALLRAACAAEPWYVAGTGRFCTKLMQLLGERAFVKFGAEGVYCAAIPEHGLGIAIKCDDGAVRAAEVTMATLIARFLTLDSSTSAALATLIKPTIKNWSGQNVGWMQPADTIR
jgi:L-asparaginase II